MKREWYLSNWFISTLFAFSFLVLPLIAGITLAILRKQKDDELFANWETYGFDDIVKMDAAKKTLERDIAEATAKQEKITQKFGLLNEYEAIQKEQMAKEKEIAGLEQKKEKLLQTFGLLDDYAEIHKAKDQQLKQTEQAQQKKDCLEQEVIQLDEVRKEKEQQLIVMDDEILFQEFGFYQPKYDLEDSAQYQDRLKEIRDKQKAMVKAKNATTHSDDWQLNGSKAEGRKMNNDNIKMVLYSFNVDCDNAIAKVKFNNIESIEKRIQSAYDKLNKMNVKNKITLKQSYLKLKFEELYLAYEYQKKKEEEKEEQRQIREEIREEQRILKEIEAEKKKIEKEEKHFQQEIKALNARLQEVPEEDDENRELLLKIQELEQKLQLVEKDKENVFDREQNTRAGYVYIISNIGSFGENVYKIGMTRRLEPMDRVRELGSASVPFLFDVHAMIFSEDAPSLENALHRAFSERRVNKVNNRKEFFRVTLKEIEAEVRKNHNKVVEFTKMAEAEQYRETKMMEEKRLVS